MLCKTKQRSQRSVSGRSGTSCWASVQQKEKDSELLNPVDQDCIAVQYVIEEDTKNILKNWREDLTRPCVLSAAKQHVSIFLVDNISVFSTVDPIARVLSTKRERAIYIYANIYVLFIYLVCQSLLLWPIHIAIR